MCTIRFELLEGERAVGSVTPNSLWTRKATVVLPEAWPLPIQVFAIWLVIVLWKRASDGAAAGAAAGS